MLHLTEQIWLRCSQFLLKPMLRSGWSSAIVKLLSERGLQG